MTVKHLNTPEARAARQASHMLRIANRDNLEVFPVRLSGSTFAWQIRRYGGLVHSRSVETYTSADLAREEGEAVLAALDQ